MTALNLIVPWLYSGGLQLHWSAVEDEPRQESWGWGQNFQLSCPPKTQMITWPDSRLALPSPQQRPWLCSSAQRCYFSSQLQEIKRTQSHTGWVSTTWWPLSKSFCPEICLWAEKRCTSSPKKSKRKPLQVWVWWRWWSLGGFMWWSSISSAPTYFNFI